MKTIKVRFTLSIGYVGCEKEDDLELEVADDATPEEIEEVVTEEYTNWVHEQNQGCYIILN